MDVQGVLARDNGVLSAAEKVPSAHQRSRGAAPSFPSAAPALKFPCSLDSAAWVVYIPAVYLVAHKVLVQGYMNKEIFLVHVCHLYSCCLLFPFKIGIEVCG